MFKRLYSQNSRLLSNFVRRDRKIKNKPVGKDFILDEFKLNKLNSVSDWKVVRQELVENDEGFLTENNVDGIILGHCISKNEYLLGSSYIKFIDKEDIKLNLASSGKYLKLLYLINEEHCFRKGNEIKQDQEIYILRKFYEIKKQYDVLDSFTLGSLIAALSLTKEWKKCVDLLEEIRVSATPTSHVYSTIISAAFLNNEQKLAWQLLEEIIMLRGNIENIVYHTYINFVAKLNKSNNHISKLEEMFQFMQNNDIIFDSNEVPLRLAQVGNEFGCSTRLTSVNNNGNCRSCNFSLEKFDLNEEEFEELKGKFFEKVIIGTNVFIKTDPSELDKFQQFIAEKQKFDVVLDGLNIAYSAGTKHTPQVFSALVASVIAHFVKQGKKVLVIGRYHMHKWPQINWRYITSNSTVFLTKNISQDDPYLLYCALNSGKDTIIVTRDLMRGHKYLLETQRLRFLFNRWLSQRQYQLIKVSGTGNPVFRIPSPFSITAQKNKDVWHVPFKENNSTDPNKISWMCVQC